MTQENIATLALQLLPVFIALSVALYKWIVAQTPQARQGHLSNVTDTVGSLAYTVVKAIEQSMPGEVGQAKKAAAASDISAILQAAGLKVPPELIDGAIEAAVYTLNNTFVSNKPAPQKPAPVLNVFPNGLAAQANTTTAQGIL